MLCELGGVFLLLSSPVWCWEEAQPPHAVSSRRRSLILWWYFLELLGLSSLTRMDQYCRTFEGPLSMRQLPLGHPLLPTVAPFLLPKVFPDSAPCAGPGSSWCRMPGQLQGSSHLLVPIFQRQLSLVARCPGLQSIGSFTVPEFWLLPTEGNSTLHFAINGPEQKRQK